jgi:hypothetical protein
MIKEDNKVLAPIKDPNFIVSTQKAKRRLLLSFKF